MIDLEVMEGEPACFISMIDGFPKPNIEWLKDDSPISSLKEGRMLMSQSGNSLCFSIDQTSHHDHGLYKVLLKNIVGETSSSAFLSIHGKNDLLICKF